MSSLYLTMITPERKLLDREKVEAVTLFGSEGQIQILPGHVPMIGALEAGTFHFRYEDGREESGVISSGFFEVQGEEVKVAAETLELKKEIDVSRARAAQQKAEAALQAADLDQNHFKKYQLKLQRSIVRQQLGSDA